MRALRWPWVALAVTLLLCAAHGVMTTRGVSAPPDQDALRDIGFAQALLDGNWFGDPSYPGALRYYPPLLSVLAAVAAALSGAGEDLPGFWVSIGPWVNLAVPLCFFLMARRLLGGAAAGAAACLVFVLWNGAAGPPSAMGGYSPWLFAPGFAQAFFFLAILLIHARVAGGRLRDAALIGGAIGLAFLAHIVPAVVLVVVVTATAFAVQGLRPRTVVWLSVVAAAQLGPLRLICCRRRCCTPTASSTMCLHGGWRLSCGWMPTRWLTLFCSTCPARPPRRCCGGDGCAARREGWTGARRSSC